MRINKRAITKCILAISAIAMLAIPKSCEAAKTAKALEMGKNYSIDLNGDGTKERVKYEFAPDEKEESNVKVKVYINDKLVYQKSSYGYWAGVEVCDFNTKDKYKELFINAVGDSDCITQFQIMQYRSKSNIKFYNGIKGKDSGLLNVDTKALSIYRIGSPVMDKGTVCFSVDSPYYNGYFGCYYCYVPAKLSGSKVVFKKQSSYVFSREQNYELAKSMKLYRTANKSRAAIKTLQAGDKFTAIKFIPVSNKKSDGAMYVYVKTADGKKGWIYFPQYEYKEGVEEYLVEKPMWG